MSKLASLAVAIVLLACSDPTGPRSDILTVDRVPAGLRFRNLTAEPVYWMAFDSESLPLIDWIPCTKPLTCRWVPPQALQIVALEDLPCCTTETREVTVVHYHLVAAAGGGLQPDSIRSLAVRL